MVQEFQPTTENWQGSTQHGQQHQTGGQGLPGRQLPQQYRSALHSVAQSIQVCGWCADQCIQMADPNMVECIRLCEEVVELGETVLALAPRESPFTSDIVRTFEQAAQACAQECGRHQHAHCQECASVLQEVPQATQTLSSVGQGQGMGFQGFGQQSSQGFGQQSSQGIGQQSSQGIGQQSSQGIGQQY